MVRSYGGGHRPCAIVQSFLICGEGRPNANNKTNARVKRRNL